MKPILQIENISKRFRISHELQPYLNFRDRLIQLFKRSSTSSEEFWALNKISFTVEAGESIGNRGRHGPQAQRQMPQGACISAYDAGRQFVVKGQCRFVAARLHCRYQQRNLLGGRAWVIGSVDLAYAFREPGRIDA